MTFNIRYDNPNDGMDAWPNRSEWVGNIINESGASIVGLQEALFHQLQEIDTQTHRFAYVGVGRDDGAQAGEFSPVLYDSTVWQVQSWETRWLSSDSSEVGVAGWDAALPRIATIVDFQNTTTGKPIRVINTHFDHRGEEARIQSAALVSRWAREKDVPTILMGDFNFEDSTPAYQQIVASEAVRSSSLNDSAVRLNVATEPTFLGFDSSNSDGPRIDYVFYSNHLTPNTYERLLPVRDGRNPSDHTPVLVSLSY